MRVLVKGCSYTLVRNAEEKMVNVRILPPRREVEMNTKLKNKRG
jgi:hypothetical protein